MIELAAFSICETRSLLHYAMNAWFVVVFSISFKEVLLNQISVQPPAFCLQDVNHSVSIDLSNENVACNSRFIILSVPYAAPRDSCFLSEFIALIDIKKCSSDLKFVCCEE